MGREGEKPFVGRAELLGRILELFGAPGRSYCLRASGTWGIGKTYLVNELTRRSVKDGRVLVIRVRAGPYLPDAAPARGDKITTEIKHRNFQAYLDLLDALAKGRVTEPGESEITVEGLERLLLAVSGERGKVAESEVLSGEFKGAFRPDVHAGGAITAQAGAVIGGFVLSDAAAKLRFDQAIDDSQKRLNKTFKTELDALGEQSGAIVLIDEFDRLRGHVVQKWMLDLVSSLDKTIVVLASWLDDDFSVPRLIQEDLTPWSVAEAEEYLGARLGPSAEGAELAQRIHRFGAGLPEAVGMAVDLLERRRAVAPSAMLEDLVLDDASPATTTLLSKIVKESDEQMKVILREGRYARRVDQELIHHLLFDTDPDDATEEQLTTTSLLLKHLLEYSFVETYDPDNDEGIGRYRFHEYISRAEAEPLDDTLHVDVEAVHENLASFYERKRDKYDEEAAKQTAYLRWYKYEQRPWQALTREWLYHASHVNKREPARLEFAQIFFEAFWWWGCYVRYDFIDRLLDDWERTQPPGDAEWLIRLREIVQWYPPGYDKLDKGDWAKVESALVWLRTKAGVGGAAQLTDQGAETARELKRRLNLRRMRAFTSLLLAHSYRFRSGLQGRAVRRYEDALDYMRRIDDAVAVAWTTFEFAELQLELNDTSSASTWLRDAATLALKDDEGDWELFANLHRLQADIASRTDAAAEIVLGSMVHAMLRAFLYLAQPNPPDPYTVTFYQEMRMRLAERLAWLLKHDERALTEALPHLLERLSIIGATPHVDEVIKSLRQKDLASSWPLLARDPPTPGAENPDLDLAIARVSAEIEDGDADRQLAEA